MRALGLGEQTAQEREPQRDQRHVLVALHHHAQPVREPVLADSVAKLDELERRPGASRAAFERREQLRGVDRAVRVLRGERDHGRALRRQVRLRYALQVGLRRAAHALQVHRLGLDPAGEQLEVAELLRLALHRLALVHLAREQVRARALELGLGRAQVAHAPHLLGDRADAWRRSCRRRAPRRRRRAPDRAACRSWRGCRARAARGPSPRGRAASCRRRRAPSRAGRGTACRDSRTR